MKITCFEFRDCWIRDIDTKEHRMGGNVRFGFTEGTYKSGVGIDCGVTIANTMSMRNGRKAVIREAVERMFEAAALSPIWAQGTVITWDRPKSGGLQADFA